MIKVKESSNKIPYISNNFWQAEKSKGEKYSTFNLPELGIVLTRVRGDKIKKGGDGYVSKGVILRNGKDEVLTVEPYCTKTLKSLKYVAEFKEEERLFNAYYAKDGRPRAFAFWHKGKLGVKLTLVMPFFVGMTFEAYAKSLVTNPLFDSFLRDELCRMLSALRELHRLRITHGDLHSDNLLHQISDGEYRLIDFGRARSQLYLGHQAFAFDVLQLSVLMAMLMSFNEVTFAHKTLKREFSLLTNDNVVQFYLRLHEEILRRLPSMTNETSWLKACRDFFDHKSTSSVTFMDILLQKINQNSMIDESMFVSNVILYRPISGLMKINPNEIKGASLAVRKLFVPLVRYHQVDGAPPIIYTLRIKFLSSTDGGVLRKEKEELLTQITQLKTVHTGEAQLFFSDAQKRYGNVSEFVLAIPININHTMLWQLLKEPLLEPYAETKLLLQKLVELVKDKEEWLRSDINEFSFIRKSQGYEFFVKSPLHLWSGMTTAEGMRAIGELFVKMNYQDWHHIEVDQPNGYFNDIDLLKIQANGVSTRSEIPVILRHNSDVTLKMCLINDSAKRNLARYPRGVKWINAFFKYSSPNNPARFLAEKLQELSDLTQDDFRLQSIKEDEATSPVGSPQLMSRRFSCFPFSHRKVTPTK